MPKPNVRTVMNYSDRPSAAQLDYLAMLFTGCGFDRQQRAGWLEKRTGRQVSYLDELTKGEASGFIEELKVMKQEVLRRSTEV